MLKSLLKLSKAFYKNVILATYDDSSYNAKNEELSKLNFGNKSKSEIAVED